MKKNPLTVVTPEQLQTLFGQSSSATTWGQVGVQGQLANQPVRIHVRSDMNSSKTFLESTILGGKPVALFVATHRSHSELLQEVANDPSAIAIGGIREASGVRALAIN